MTDGLYRPATCHVPRATCGVPRATCHVPRATCRVPRATCHVPRAACHVRRALPAPGAAKGDTAVERDARARGLRADDGEREIGGDGVAQIDDGRAAEAAVVAERLNRTAFVEGVQQQIIESSWPIPKSQVHEDAAAGFSSSRS